MKIILFLYLISAIYNLYHQFRIVYLIRGFHKQKLTPKDILEPVSIIICAKNEQENISKNLDSILNQNYPQFEVIIVDDCSTDSTSTIVKEFQKDYPQLRLLQPENAPSNSKRNALKTGILTAKHEILLLTDADCKPLSKDWIKTMSTSLSSEKACVLGYSPYVNYPSYLNLIIQFETFQTAGLYLSRAIAGKAYMSVGRNVMYTKAFFLANENFENESHLTSGDDDLLIQNVKEESKITVNLNPKSFVLSQPKKTWKSWWNQKLRHYSTAPHYSNNSQIYLGLYHLSQALFWFGFLILIFSEYSKAVLFIVLISITIKSVFIGSYAKLLKVSKAVLFIWPILEASLLGLQLGLGINGRLKKQKTW